MKATDLLEIKDNVLVYKENIKCTYSDLDEYGYIFPQRYLQFFQNSSAAHSALLHMGFSDLIKNNWIWIVAKLRYTVLKKVNDPDLKVITFVHKPGRLIYMRDYLLFSGQDLIAKGSGEYTVLNALNRRLVLSGIKYPASDYPDYEAYSTLFPLIKYKEDNLKLLAVHKVVYSDLDENRHANNTSYARWITDAVYKRLDDLTINEMNFHYERECLLNENISIYESIISENSSVILGKKEDGSLCFSSLVSFNRKND